MANFTHSGSQEIEPIGQRGAGRSKFMPAVLAVLVLLSGFGLGALYASFVNEEAPVPEQGASLTADDLPVLAQPPAGAVASASAATAAVTPTAPPDPGFGSTEVAFVTNFPLVDFDWERVTIPMEEGFDLRWFGLLGDAYAAVGFGWQIDGGEYLATWKSPDGSEWTEAGRLEIPEGTSMYEVVGSDGRLFAMGESWERSEPGRRVVYGTPDGVEWSEFGLPYENDGSGYAYLQGVAANETGTVVVMTIENYPEEPPQTIEIKGFTVEVNHRFGSYTLMDASGTEVLSGSTEDIWHWQEDGQGIFHPSTGELITTVPWEVWEQGWSSAYDDRAYGSPLPIPLEPTEPYIPPTIAVDWDGYLITVDEGAGEYAVVETESGETIAAGPIEQIWRGPAPVFEDPETGRVILSVTWEEWDKAEEASWMNYEEAYYGDTWYHTETIALFSADGAEWIETAVSSSSSGSTVTVMATEGEFILNVASYGEFGENRAVWTSTDGTDWAVGEPIEDGERYLHSTIATEDGLLGIGEGPGGQAIWSSERGERWVSEFTIGPQDDGTYVWLTAMADGPIGTVVVGNREGPYDYQPLAIEKGGLTAEFEGEFVVRITTEAGEEALLLTWDDVESGTLGELVVYENEETLFYGPDGELLMTITNQEAQEAYESRDEEAQPAVQQVMFLQTDGTWHEVAVGGAGVNYVSGMVVGDSRVLLGGVEWDNSYYPEEGFGGGSSSMVVLIGEPAE